MILIEKRVFFFNKKKFWKKKDAWPKKSDFFLLKLQIIEKNLQHYFKKYKFHLSLTNQFSITLDISYEVLKDEKKIKRKKNND